MLKIKDDVNLKILEKYGFEYHDYDGTYMLKDKKLEGVCYFGTKPYISIACWNKKLSFVLDNSNELINIIIQMIEEGIIENNLEKIKEIIGE